MAAGPGQPQQRRQDAVPQPGGQPGGGHVSPEPPVPAEPASAGVKNTWKDPEMAADTDTSPVEALREVPPSETIQMNKVDASGLTCSRIKEDVVAQEDTFGNSTSRKAQT